MIRIGGEFEIDATLFAAPEIHQEDHYPGKFHLWTDTGRSAIYIALSDILAKGGIKEARLPAFCCESVILPFVQLGFNVRFYSMGDGLGHFQPPDVPEGATFLFINYFGLPNRQVNAWLDSPSRPWHMFVIEDNVQATLSAGLGIRGDYIVNSFRKVLPQPDGAIVASNHPISCQLEEADESFISQRVIAKLIRDGNEDSHLRLVRESEERLDRTVIPRRPSWVSCYLFKRADLDEIRDIRRSNWNRLLDLLGEDAKLSRCLQPLFPQKVEQEAPLGFPVIVQGGVRDRLRGYLMRQQIFCPVHWLLSKDLYEDAFKSDYELSGSILTLPIDQRMVERHLAYMVRMLSKFFSEGEST